VPGSLIFPWREVGEKEGADPAQLRALNTRPLLILPGLWTYQTHTSLKPALFCVIEEMTRPQGLPFEELVCFNQGC